jgi:HEAT repeat protein
MQKGQGEIAVEGAAAALLRWCREREAGLLADAVSVLARARVPGVAEHVAPLAQHPEPEVRLAAAQALVELQDASPASAAALVALSRDRVEEIRSWATFGLASDRLADAEGVHEALAARLEDSSDEVRVEAVRGLAMRGDVRAIDAAFDLAPQWSGDPVFRDAVRRIQPA